MMMGPGFGYNGGFGMGGGSLMMIIGFLLIGYLFYLAFTSKSRGAGQDQASVQNGSTQAIELAKLRLARGEISIEEFEQIKANL